MYTFYCANQKSGEHCDLTLILHVNYVSTNQMRDQTAKLLFETKLAHDKKKLLFSEDCMDYGFTLISGYNVTCIKPSNCSKE